MLSLYLTKAEASGFCLERYSGLARIDSSLENALAREACGTQICWLDLVETDGENKFCTREHVLYWRIRSWYTYTMVISAGLISI